GGFSVLRVFPETGRLHQIRVHMAAIGHPVLGDMLYTGEGDIYRRLIQGQVTPMDLDRIGFPRLALHAAQLTFHHPVTQKKICIESPLPSDMAEFLKSATLSA